MPAAGRDAGSGERPGIVVEARIESRLSTLDTQASIFKDPGSIRASSPLNISFDIIQNGS